MIVWIEHKLPKPSRLKQTKRISLIVIVYLLILGLLALLFYYIVTAIIDSSVLLVENAPQYISRGLFAVQEWAEIIRQQFPPEVQIEVNRYLLEASDTIGNAIRNLFRGGVAQLPSTFSLIFSFVTLPIFLFYILKDWEKIGNNFYSAFHPVVADYLHGVISVIEGVFGRYIRAQILLGIIVAYLSFIGLLILKIPFAPVLSILAGVTELIPVLGPWIGGAAAVIITLAVVPSKVIWVIILFFAIQLVENNLLVPRIQSAYLRIHPAMVLFLLILGAYLAGFWGLILAVPLTATIVGVYRYISSKLRDEEA